MAGGILKFVWKNWMAKLDAHTDWAALLADYASGKLSEEQMHAIEEAAHNDPFLMDALEGYVLLGEKNHIDRANDIVRALPAASDPGESAKTIPLFSRRWIQWSVAAAVVLLVGIGIMNMPQSEEPSVTALLDENDKPEADKPNKNIASVEFGDSIRSQVVVPANLPENIVRNADNLPRGLKQKEPAPAETPAVINTSPAARTSVDISATSFRANGKVIDKDSEEPIDNAVIELGGMQVISDPIGRFYLSTAKLPLEVKVGAAGYRTTVLTWHEGDNYLLVPLQKLPPTTEELVVQDLSRRTTAAGMVVVPNDTADTAPVGGWQAFNAYFKSNMKAKGTSRLYKSVTLSFSIMADGTPGEIEVSQSAGKEAEAEAIKLLQEGPKWRTNAAGQAMATITVKYQ